MNLAPIVNLGNNIAVPTKGQQLSPQGNQIFGNIFGQILSNQQVQPTIETLPNMSEQDVIQDLQTILNATSLEELESLIGSEELEVNPKQLKELINKLLDEETDNPIEIEESNVWDLLAGIQQQASKLTDAITLSLNGQGNATAAEAKQAVQLLKIAQLIGNKSDLTLKQESTVFDLKNLLEDVKENTKDLVFKENTKLDMMQGLKPVIQQVIVRQVQTQRPTEIIVETKETSNLQPQAANIVQTKIETVSITLPAEKPAQSEEFIKELQKVMNRVQFGQTNGANRLVIKLYPEQLGTIRIELVQKDGILTAKMLASTTLGKEMLDSNSNHLRQSLVHQNIQLDKLEITQALQDTNRQERNQSFEESFKQHQEQQQEQADENLEEQSSFEEFLKEMEV